jgi:hypothetical protein
MTDILTDQGKQYAAFIDAELQREIDRRDSANARAGSALTGATGLVTLVLAVFAVFLGKESLVTGWAKVFIAAAVLALLAAGGCAVAALRPLCVRLEPWGQSILEGIDISPLRHRLRPGGFRATRNRSPDSAPNSTNGVAVRMQDPSAPVASQG